MKVLPLLLTITGSAVAGFAAGILLAPRKGNETREIMMNYFKSQCPCCKDRIKAMADQIECEVKECADACTDTCAE